MKGQKDDEKINEIR
jgi:hypothetical protein